MEILSPIKNIQNAKIAIKNGSDALYLASPSFGARVNASIAQDEIIDIVKLAKSHRVKTYITFNIVIFEDELDEFSKQLTALYNAGIDGIIIQDFSFISTIKKNFSELEIHCSTQMHIHNSNATQIIKDMGANRIVVPREMNFQRIKNLKKNTAIDIEAFVHGALCVCYSGQCYDSTLLDQKSANRGRCSQYCRMKQKIINKRTNKNIAKGEYPLNLKDLNNINILNKYKDAGINSIKIEGRLKNIDYVGHTAKAYYNKLNNIKDNISLDEVYNRTFTSGRINSQNGSELVNLNRPNNTGKYIGNIINIKKNTNSKLGYYKFICTVKTTYNLNTKDNIRFISDNFEYGQEIEQIEKIDKNIFNIYTKENIPNHSKVYITKNQTIINNYLNDIKSIDTKRKNIDINLSINNNSAHFSFNNKPFTLNLDIQVADKHPLTKAQVITILDKTKNTDFIINVSRFDLSDNLFIANKELKRLRDFIIKQFINEETHHHSYMNKNTIFNSFKDNTVQKSKQYYISCRTIKQLLFFQNNNQENLKILVEFQLVKQLIQENLTLFNTLNDNLNLFIILPRIIYDDEQQEIIDILPHFKNLCISEIGSLKYLDINNFNEIITNFTFNTTNSININYLNSLNIHKHMLSIELNKERINEIGNNNSIVNIYGRIPVMIMDYCPINLNKTDSCGSCTRCRSNNYFLEDNLKRKFPLVYEGNNRIGMYTENKLSLFNHLNEIPNIKNFFLNLTFESDYELKELLMSINDNNLKTNNNFKGCVKFFV